MSDPTWGDLYTAAEFRDYVRSVASGVLEEERPAPKFATVESIDRTASTCQVIYQGDTDPVTVAMYAIQPDAVAQVVIVDGPAGRRAISTVLGDVYLPAATNPLPAGGTTGQSLTKVSGTDYDVEWTTVTGSSLTYPDTTAAFLRDDGEWTNWLNGGLVAGDSDLTSNWRTITYTCTAGTTTIAADPGTFSAADDGKVIRSTTFDNLPWDARLVWTGSTSSIDFDSPSGGVTVGTGDTALVGSYRYAENFESRLDDLFIGHTSTLLTGDTATYRDSVAMHIRLNHTWDVNPNASIDGFAIGPPGVIEVDGLVRIGENAPAKDNFGGSSFNTARTYRNIRGQVARPGGFLYGTTFSDHWQADTDELYVYQALGPTSNATLHSINGGAAFGGRFVDFQPGEDFVRPAGAAAPYWTEGGSAQLGMWIGVQSASPTITGDASTDGVVDKTVGFDHGGFAWRSLGPDVRIVEGSDIIYAEDGTDRTETGVDITTAGAVLYKVGAFSADDVGRYVKGTGILPGTYISLFTDADHVQLSTLATVGTGVSVQISGAPVYAFSSDDIGLGIGNDGLSGPTRDSIANLGWKVFVVELLDEQSDGTASMVRISAIARENYLEAMDPDEWAYRTIAVENNFGIPNYSNARVAYGVRTADPIKLFDTGNKNVRGVGGADTTVWFDLDNINFIEADGQYRSVSTKGPRLLRWNPTIRMADNGDTAGGNLALWLTPTIETDPDAVSSITTLGASYGMLYSPKIIANGHTGVGLNSQGHYSRPALSVLNSGTITSGVITGFSSLLDVGSGVSGVTRYGFKVAETTGAGALTNQYGLYVDAMTKASGLNIAAYLAGTTVDGAGNLSVAGTLAAASMTGLTVHDDSFQADILAAVTTVTAGEGLYGATLDVTGLATVEGLKVLDPAGSNIGYLDSTASVYGSVFRAWANSGDTYQAAAIGFSTLFAPDSGYIAVGAGGSTALDAFLIRYAAKTMRMQSSITADQRDAIFQVDGAVQPMGLTGAVAASRYVGAISSGTTPSTGTWAVGDWVIDNATGTIRVCTVAGTPGTWTAPGGGTLSASADETITGGWAFTGRHALGYVNTTALAGGVQLANTTRIHRCNLTANRTLATGSASIATTGAVDGQLITVENDTLTSAGFTLTINATATTKISLVDAAASIVLKPGDAVTFQWNSSTGYWVQLAASSPNLQAYSAVAPGALGLAMLPMTTLTNKGILLGNAAAAPTALATDASTTKFLKSGGSSTTPAWTDIAISHVTSLQTSLDAKLSAGYLYIKNSTVSLSGGSVSTDYSIPANTFSANGIGIDAEYTVSIPAISGRGVIFTIELAGTSVLSHTITPGGATTDVVNIKVWAYRSTTDTLRTVVTLTSTTGTKTNWASIGSLTFSAAQTLRLTMANTSGTAADAVLRMLRVSTHTGITPS